MTSPLYQIADCCLHTAPRKWRFLPFTCAPEKLLGIPFFLKLTQWSDVIIFWFGTIGQGWEVFFSQFPIYYIYLLCCWHSGYSVPISSLLFFYFLVSLLSYLDHHIWPNRLYMCTEWFLHTDLVICWLTFLIPHPPQPKDTLIVVF